MSMCAHLNVVANFDEAMIFLKRRQPRATGILALPVAPVFKIPEIPANQRVRASVSGPGSRYLLSSGIRNVPGRAFAPEV